LHLQPAVQRQIAACALALMEKDMSTELALHDGDGRRPLDNAVRPGGGPADRPFDRWGSPQGQSADELVSQRLNTRGARPPNLESEHEGAERDLTPQDGGPVAAAGPTTGFEGALAMPLSRPRRADPVERGAANVPPLVTTKAGDNSADARSFAQTEQPRGMPLVTRRTEMNEVILAWRALVEQTRLVLRDGRRLVRRLLAVCVPSKYSRAPLTSSRPPLTSVPLVVLRSTTERDQIEIHDLVQSLSADGHRVAPRGPQWVVYTEIPDRRRQSGQGLQALSDGVHGRSLRQRRRDDTGTVLAAPASIH
jgi:hypothetical protein